MQAILQAMQNARALARRMAAAPGADQNAAAALQAHVDNAIAATQAEALHPARLGPESSWRRPLPDGFVRPSGIGTVAAGITTAAFPIQWPTEGWCVGITAGTVDNTLASIGAMSVRVTINGTRELASDGQAAAFLQFSTAFSNPDGQQQWLPCCIPFNQRDTWQVYFRNESGAGPFTPVIVFAYVTSLVRSSP